MNTQAIVLFDGVCNLCAASIQFIIKRDRTDYFSFCSMQSQTGQALLREQGIDPKAMDTFVVIDNGRSFTKSTAALYVATRLKGLWPILFVFYLLPRWLRDCCYDVIASNRYRWFGKTDYCMLPTKGLMAKFLA